MRILMLASFGRCRRSTVDRRLTPLARALAARGHQVELLIPAWDCTGGGDVMEVSKQGGPEIRVIAPPRGWGWYGLYPALLARLQQEVDTFAPDVLMVNKGLGYAGWIGARWLKRGGRVMLDVDDLEVAWMRVQRRHPLLVWFLARQERALIQRATRITVASRYLQTHWSIYRKVDPAPSSNSLTPPNTHTPYYLPNGLIPAATRAPVENNPPRVLLPTRGHDVDAAVLARVWARVYASQPQAELLIVGGWRPPKLLPNTRVLGWLPFPDYIETIRSVAVCLFVPTKKALVRAKSPARVLDCLAQGVPLLTLDVGEYAALVREVEGKPFADERALTHRLQRLLADSSARARHSQEAFDKMPRLSWDHRAKALENGLEAAMMDEHSGRNGF